MTGTREVIERTEVLQPGPAEALAGLLDVQSPDLEADGLPLLWHWMYLLERPRQDALGVDGHPVRGVLPAPPEPGRRRMWAGGRVWSLAPLRVGVATVRRTTIESTTEKVGRSGPMTFVVVRHVIEQCGATVVVEEQDIVYRDAAPHGTPPRWDESEAIGSDPDDWSLPVDETLLFRFSALTYNAHRIHYDRDYAGAVEGYPGLVVHGPLQAIAMAEAIRRRGPTGCSSINYRLVSPLIDHQGMVVVAEEASDGRWHTSVRDRSGRITASGSAITSRRQQQ